MRFERKYCNYNFEITVFTNSRVILGLVDNFVDFYGHRFSLPKIKIDYHLEQVLPGRERINKELKGQDWFDKSNDLVSHLDNRLASVRTNPGKAYVKATIFNYDESCKENILDFVLCRPLRFIMAYRGYFFLHASAVSKGKTCIVISGEQDSGKSITALTLAQNGFRFLSDDDCYVKSDGKSNILIPFPTKIGLNNKTLARNGIYNKYIIRNYRYGTKRRFSARDIFKPNGHGNHYSRKVILFPRYEAGGKASLISIPSGEAFNRLYQKNAYLYVANKYRKMSKDNFQSLCNFVDGSRTFELVYNDGVLQDVPGMVKQLLDMQTK